MTKRPSLVFVGTPQLAELALQRLHQTGLYDIAGVITQPDTPAGRGQKLTPPPVKVAAQTLGLPVFQPTSVRHIQLDSGTGKLFDPQNPDSEICKFLNSIPKIDVFILVAYGKIIPRALLDFPRLGILNVHLSLLPRWRGAAPIHHALFAGDSETGVSIMKLAEGLDTGPVYATKKIPIAAEDNLGSLYSKLAELGASFLIETLPQILNGSLKATPQSEVGVSYAEKWDKADLVINWEEPADITLRRIRTSAPEPGARANFQGVPLKIFAAKRVPNQNFPSGVCGEVVEVTREELIVALPDGQYISLLELQFPGKTRMKTADILRGRAFKVGDRFTA